jgi:MFS family permease
VLVFAAAMTVTTGSWIAGVPTFVRDTLHRGAGGFSMVMIGFAVGAIVVGALLARVRVRAKARASMLAWALYLPAYGLIALTSSLPLLVVAAVGTGAGETISYVLLNSAAQEEVPDAVLGRVLGVISFVHRGAHATGLLLVAPLFAVAAARPLFGAAACVTAAIGLVGAALAVRVARGVPNSI